MLDAEDRGDCGWGDGPAGGSFGPAEAVRLAKNLAKNCQFAVLPVRDDKAPACPRGFHAAANDPDAIEELWHRYPAPLIGIATGAASDLAVLDLDVKHPEAVRWWRKTESRLPPSRAYRTRSGGVHLFFRHAPRAPWPNWLTREIWPPRPPVRPVTASASEAGIAALGAKVAGAAEGNRNSILFWAAKRLAEKRMPAREIENMLIPATLSAGLAELEARRTVASAVRR